MTNAIVSPTFTPEQLESLTGFAADFAMSEIDGDEAVKSFARLIGSDVEYTAWEVARKSFHMGYQAKRPGMTKNAYDAAWSRFVARLELVGCGVKRDPETGKIIKPKKTEGAAPKMAAKRAADKNIVEGKSKAELEVMRADAAAKIHAGDMSKETLKIVSLTGGALAKMAKDEEKAAEKAATDATKTRRATVTEYVKSCPPAVLHLFELLQDATADNVAPDVQAMAVKHLMDAMKPAKAKPAAKK